ncbi:hypothetical protein TPHA_0J02280 [Tetrapisispora phaffii CBS 4417]|uniref:Uncharacterized protein n=1 Tax=Tetrapisispora phaffii (strain ATCC 24235 / CBS 4417 / NBRC 1672 / NRRL Y-8282 / UCD 70-5) TaxID=1071381 RepID=G8BYV6_TETPH|nr:hypothetical protein TPHA_0J02280 [Tetrapisispora phaffii CBS 4417]CCE65048.1 hypothetical protein TPHA_0J02280 [Tetrapisispora phaffii CBS 4417]
MYQLLEELKYFLSVESLDSRIIAEPINLVDPDEKEFTASKRKDAKGKKNNKNKSTITVVNKPLWNTLEFKLYYVAFAIVVPWMLKVAMDASSESNPNYPAFEGLLSKGWMFGRKVDNSDSQYRFFRDNLMLLVGLMILHTSVKKVILIVLKSTNKIKFDCIFGMIFIFALHGVNSIRLMSHVLVVFILSHLLRNNRKTATIVIWSYAIFSLFFNSIFWNYPLGQILDILSPIDSSFKGIIERWDVFYNFTLLRILSYNLDYLQRYSDLKGNSGSRSSSIEETNTSNDSTKKTQATERERLIYPHPLEEYRFANYFAYITYAPLFIAGPIITFNDYVYQSKNQSAWINKKAIVSYAIKVFIAVLTMETILHFTYVVAVSKRKAWGGDSPFQMSMIGLLNLNIIWLKLMIPWRLFRLWAMIDGMDTPENMIRCVDNNYSALAFWRAWHRSYNKWVVHYIYIPLGGSNNRILTTLTVFSFVAIWHDIQLKLLLWGWLIVLFLLPELFLTRYFSKYQSSRWYRHICAVGAVINIWMMMIANLFGFCLGADGTKLFLNDIFGSLSGLAFFITASGCLFIAVQLMFEQREAEKRAGIFVKC